MALVYLVTNTVNGKRYIGYTSRTLDYRKYTHLWAARSKKYNKQVFTRAIRKYGEDAFHFETLQDGLSLSQATRLEAQLILDADPEYNVARGPQKASGSKWDKIRRERTVPKLKASWTPARKAEHSQKFRGVKKPPHVIQAMLAGCDRRKKVICLDDGLVHESILAAAAYYNISKKGISEACCGRGLSANGKYFAHYHDGFMDADRLAKLSVLKAKKANRCVNSAKVRSRPVICVTDGRWHTSGRAAAKAYGVHASAIMYFCQTGGQSKSGLRFMYADQGKPVEKQPIAPEVRMKSIQALRRSTDSRKKKIRNLDDGIVYESVTAAGKALSRSSGDISATIQRNGRCAGKRLAYAA
jgi:predicted GIY-YIG superfamily endonuclease